MEMMKHRLVTLAFCAALAAPCSGQYEVGIPCEALAAYLRSGTVDEKREADAYGIIDRSQLIYLHYDHSEPSDEPAEHSRFALSIKASCVVPIWHHAADGKSYPKINLVFSKLYGDSRDASASQWIAEMKRPIAAGYTLTYVRVVPTPEEAVKKKTSAIAESIVRDFASQLAELKPEFPELESFDPSSSCEGRVFFSYGLGSASKDGREKLNKDWCEIVFWIAPITGNPRQQPIPTKTYPLQATEACWRIKSANPELQKRLTTAVTVLLKRLDGYEREIVGEPSGTTTPPTVP